MGHWGWRPLIICVFISVWVVGCNIVTDAAPNLSPTPSPHVTLTVRRIATATPTVNSTAVVAQATMPARTPETSPAATGYTVQAGDTLGAIAAQFGLGMATLQAANTTLMTSGVEPGQRLNIPLLPAVPAPPPQPFVASPTCYETAAASLLCMGYVENMERMALERIVLRVELAGDADDTMAQQIIEIEQAVLSPGERAPYRALFGGFSVDEVVARAVLVSAAPVEAAQTRFAALHVDDETGTMADRRYVVTATVTNPGPNDAVLVRAVVMLLDERERVVGYRVATITERLEAGARTPLRIDLIPQTNGTELSHTLHVEGRLEPAE